jgi:hypothetical protein
MTTTSPAAPLAGEILVITGGVGTVKEVLEVAVPDAVTMLMGAVTTPTGAVAVTDVGELMVNVVGMVPNRTLVTPIKFVPVMTTLVPAAPLAGVKLAIVGAGVGGASTVKFVALVAVPIPVRTVIRPVTAAAGTVAIICVAVLDLIVASTPPKRTSVAPPRFVPVIVTDEPAIPLVGEKLVMVGVGVVTVNIGVGAGDVPSDVITTTLPVKVNGTTAVICVGELTTSDVAVAPPIRTDVNAVPVNPVPVITIDVPTGPLVGAMLVIVGGTRRVPVASKLPSANGPSTLAL